MISLKAERLNPGGGRGIGLAITRAFAEAGATVIITYTSKDPSEIAKSVSEEFKTPVHSYYCPGEKSEIVNQVVDKIAKEIGEVDVIVANAGVCQWRDTVDMTDGASYDSSITHPTRGRGEQVLIPDELNWVTQVNLFAPIYLSRAFARHWLKMPTSLSDPAASKEKGTREEKQNLNKKILFVSSISGIVSMTPQNQVSYNASKAGLTMAAKVSLFPYSPLTIP